MPATISSLTRKVKAGTATQEERSELGRLLDEKRKGKNKHEDEMYDKGFAVHRTTTLKVSIPKFPYTNAKGFIDETQIEKEVNRTHDKAKLEYMSGRFLGFIRDAKTSLKDMQTQREDLAHEIEVAHRMNRLVVERFFELDNDEAITEGLEGAFTRNSTARVKRREASLAADDKYLEDLRAGLIEPTTGQYK